MAIGNVIIDPQTGKRMRVTDDGALPVIDKSASEPYVPPIGTPNRIQFLFGKLGENGLNDGATTIDVDGDPTPVSRYIYAADDYDIYIKQITIIISDGSLPMDKFGGSQQLDNGLDLVWTESGTDTYIVEKATTNGILLIQSGLRHPFGTSSDFHVIKNYNANADALIVNIEVSAWITNGLRLGRGTLDNFRVVINDDITFLDDGWVYVYGEKRFP